MIFELNMIKNKNQLNNFFSLLVLLILLFLYLPKPLLSQAQNNSNSNASATMEENLNNETILELNKKISDKRKEIEDLKDTKQSYSKKIDKLLTAEKTLNNQIDYVENLIAKTEIDLKVTETEIKETIYKIQQIKLQIKDRESDIKAQREYLESLLKLIYNYDKKSYLEILLVNNSMSSFLEEVKYLKNIQNELGATLNKVEILKDKLVAKETELDQQKQDLKNQKNQLVNTQESLSEERLLKDSLLQETKSSERRYQNLLVELKQEQENIENETAVLEKRMREKLAKQENALAKLGEVHLTWPVSPDRGLSAIFHDPDYPFRYIFEHPGIDIRAYQGTEIKAAETGYVGTAKNSGMGYSYIMLVHNEGVSTVYGHVSRIDVAEGDYVTKGQVIGLSGGMPGTRGAGRLTTGPHLHFEVRYNGIPVNPVNYLP